MLITSRFDARPDTAGEELQVFCSLSLKINLPLGYPRLKAAEVHLENLLGLNEEDARDLQKALLAVSNEMKEDNSPALFNLIQCAKDFINSRNIPSDDCCICLCPFEDDEDFFKTPCAHCFHAECLARWTHDQEVQAVEKQTREGKRSEEEDIEHAEGSSRCPICRGGIGGDLTKKLKKWTEPLVAAHKRDCARREEEKQLEEKLRQKQSAARAWEERRRWVCCCGSA